MIYKRFHLHQNSECSSGTWDGVNLYELNTNLSRCADIPEGLRFLGISWGISGTGRFWEGGCEIPAYVSSLDIDENGRMVTCSRSESIREEE